MSEAEKDELWDWIAAGDVVERKPPAKEFDPRGRLPIEAWD
jgi:hypothetical protein